MRYRKGFETKENILNVSRQMFYKYGYTKATVQKIADTAEIPLGLIPYYFKTKDNIVLEINSKFYLEIYEFVNNRVKENRNNSYYKLFLVTSIYYRIILADEQNRKFFYEVLRNKSNFKALSFSQP